MVLKENMKSKKFSFSGNTYLFGCCCFKINLEQSYLQEMFSSTLNTTIPLPKKSSRDIEKQNYLSNEESFN